MTRTDIEDVARRAGLLSPDEQLLLLERLARQVRTQLHPAHRVSLRGVWKGKVPADQDVEGLLRQIRSSWRPEDPK